MVTLLRFTNAFAASALIMALSTLLVPMHVDFVIQLGACSIFWSVSSCVTPSTMSLIMGLYSLLSSAVHFCPDGYTCGNVRKPATLCVCILHSDDWILTINSFTQNCWNRLHAGPSLPLTVQYITLQRSHPVVTVSWMKSPIKSMDMPPNVQSELYIDCSFVSNRIRNCALNMETSSTTTIFNWFPPSDLNISSIAVPALKLGVHVLKTLWKVQPCGKCNAPTPVGHVQWQISLPLANSSKILHLTNVFPVPPPACNNANFCVEVSSISTKIPFCSLFNLFSESKWKTVFHWSSVNPSLWSIKIAFKLFHCLSVKWHNCIVSMKYSYCFFVNIVWLMLSNILYVSFMHIKVNTPLWSLIGVSFGPFVLEWFNNCLFQILRF